MRNPWGDRQEWRGTWKDGAREWGFIPDEVRWHLCIMILSMKMDSYLTNQEKERMGLNFDNDGEWWMSYRLTTSNIIWGSRKSCYAKYLTHPYLTINAKYNAMFCRDFAANFDQFEMCSISPESLGDCQADDCAGRWCVTSWHGELEQIVEVYLGS